MARMLAQTTLDWLTAPFERPADVLGFALWVVVFPLYHTLYPQFARWMPGRTMAEQVDTLRRSWIARVLANMDIVAAAHQTQNLNTVNTFLASSAVILIGFAANMVVGSTPLENAEVARVVLVMMLLAVAFAHFVSSLRHIGHFTLTIGADPALVDRLHGSAADYFGGILARASLRYTQGVRTLYSVFPLFLWLFDPWLFAVVTVLWAIWFVAQDFPRRG